MMFEKLCLPFVLILIILVSGCTSSTEPQKIGELGVTTTTIQQTTITTQTTSGFKIGDVVSNNVIALMVNSMRFEDMIISTGQFGGTPWVSDEGKRFLVVDVTVQNVGKNSEYFAAGSLTVSDTDDFSYNIDSKYLFLDNKLDVASNLQPDKKVKGEVAFQIPSNATPKEIVYNDIFNKPITIQLKLS